MTRRSLTLLLASVLALGLAGAGSFATVPYVALKPGPACNTLGTCYGQKVLSFSPERGKQRSGALQLTTVSVEDHLTLFEALAGWLSPSEAVLPREVVFEPDKTQEQNNQETAQEMVDSQDAATTAAMTYLGYKGTIRLYVSAVTSGAPADGKLKAGDRITSVDGTAVKSADQLRKLISGRAVGEAVAIGYVRAGRPGSVTVTTVAAPDSSKRAIVGITPGVRTEFPIKVDIKLKDVGGPSAGLMFALGIVDLLGPVDLTAGVNVAGTGEITPEGAVSPIGGIAQKMRGAKAEGATVFLSPADNCDEARKTKPSGITLVKVSTLKTALDALRILREHGTPPSC
ncbi:MAG: PDZ domain-containing protein [Mycobacteriales bacterium]